MHLQPTRCCWQAFTLAAGLLVLCGRVSAGVSGRFDLERPLKQLGYEVVQLRRTGENHLFLFGQVEGRRRSCLVDTGWSFAAVSTNTAGRLTETNLIQQLTLGRVVLTNESILVQDMRVNGQPTSYDVVLGCDFLLRHHAVLDVAGRRLYLRRARLTVAEREQLERALSGAGWGKIELTQRQPLALTGAAQITGHPVELLVDSGATWSCLDAKVAESMKLRAVPTLHRILGPAAPGPRNFAVADLKSWRLGGLPMRETSVAVFDLTAWGLGPDGKLFSDVGGILGGAELFATGAVIDCGGMKLWLRHQR